MLGDFQAPPFSQSAGLVKDNGIETTRFLECLTTTLDQNTMLRRKTTTNKERSWGSQSQSTRTGNDKDCNGKFQTPESPTALCNIEVIGREHSRVAKGKPDDKSKNGNEGDHRNKMGGKKISNPL